MRGNELCLTKTYTCNHLCELVKTSTAQPLMTYETDFYAGMGLHQQEECAQSTLQSLVVIRCTRCFDCRLSLQDKRVLSLIHI